VLLIDSSSILKNKVKYGLMDEYLFKDKNAQYQIKKNKNEMV
jgi:hypothetical protein